MTKRCPNCQSEIPIPEAARDGKMTLTCLDCGVSLTIKRRNVSQEEPAAETAPPALIDQTDDSQFADDGAVWPGDDIDHGHSDVPTSQSAPPFGFFTNPLLTRRVLFALVWAGPIILCNLLGVPLILITPDTQDIPGILCSATCLVFVWMLAGYFAAKFAAWLGTPLLVSQIKCPGCRQLYPAKGNWGCSCGFTPPPDAETHILLFRCSMCSAYLSHFDCPVCSTTIRCQ